MDFLVALCCKWVGGNFVFHNPSSTLQDSAELICHARYVDRCRQQQEICLLLHEIFTKCNLKLRWAFAWEDTTLEEWVRARDLKKLGGKMDKKGVNRTALMPTINCMVTEVEIIYKHAQARTYALSGESSINPFNNGYTCTLNILSL